MARCTLLVSCLTDLDYCVVFVDRVGVFPEHVHWILKASEQFTSNFSVASLCIACLLAGSKHYNRCSILIRSESITGQPAFQLVIMTKFPGSSWTVLVLRMKVFVNTLLEHYWQTVFTKTVHILRAGLRLGLADESCHVPVWSTAVYVYCSWPLGLS